MGGRLRRLGHVRPVVKTRWTGKQRRIDTYRYVHPVPLRDSAEALRVNGCELTTTTATGKVVIHQRVGDLPPDDRCHRRGARGRRAQPLEDRDCKP